MPPASSWTRLPARPSFPAQPLRLRQPTPPRLPLFTFGCSAPAPEAAAIAEPPIADEGLRKPGPVRITDGPSLANGCLAHVQDLESRPELNGDIVTLATFDPAADRWECNLGGGDGLRLRLAKLSPIPDLDRVTVHVGELSSAAQIGVRK